MDKRLRHGLCKSYAKPPEYTAWINMRQRCARTGGPDFPNYRGRGISVAPEWASFERFFADMGPRPSPAHTVERKNNDLGYSASNCEWATREVQNSNQRRRQDNASGVRGVSALAGGFYLAAGSRSKQRFNLYYGQDLFEACCARKSWELKLGDLHG